MLRIFSFRDKPCIPGGLTANNETRIYTKIGVQNCFYKSISQTGNKKKYFNTLFLVPEVKDNISHPGFFEVSSSSFPPGLEKMPPDLFLGVSSG